MTRLLNAVIYTATVEVTCPHCGGCQPDPDGGSHLWTPDQLVEGNRECVDCDEPFRLTRPAKATIDRVPGARGDK